MKPYPIVVEESACVCDGFKLLNYFSFNEASEFKELKI